ncbi:Uncharacterised protein [Yersinia similis]|uniref:Uncharacterized protein n=1 Tax=Yersinia similis TaxID=367190 RepID=A0A0T9QXT2_9GAMM|nr:Uncharacterised protein [Yersinia similis]CNI34210.1 Uncharacterised protein [Yersinia similis]
MVTIYFFISMLSIILNFIPLRKMLLSDEVYPHVYALIISCIPALIHFYVLNFREIPFLNIDVSENETIIYMSLILGWLSAIPYIVARRMYT